MLEVGKPSEKPRQIYLIAQLPGILRAARRVDDETSLQQIACYHLLPLSRMTGPLAFLPSLSSAL